MLTVSVPAIDRALLTIEELRAAAGVTGSGQDAALTALGLRIADQIAEHCKVPDDGVHPPTLLQETLVETFWLGCRPVQPLILSRRWLGTVGVVEDGEAVDGSGFEIKGPSGMLYRLCDDRRTAWSAAKVIVTYQAGWATVPTTLKAAAMQMVRLATSQASRDPLTKRERVRTDGVEEVETDYWVGPINGAPIPADAAGMLERYVTSSEA